MQPYTDTENTLRDSNAQHHDHANWPTLADVEFHRRNAEIIRSEAVGDALRFVIVFARGTWRKVHGLHTKLRTSVTKPGAPA